MRTQSHYRSFGWWWRDSCMSLGKKGCCLV